MKQAFLRYIYVPFYFKFRAPIYIDTSALRSLPKDRWKKPRGRYFTSGLTILEMLTNFLRQPGKAYPFNVARAAFRFLEKNQISIDWRVSEDVFNDAFPNISRKKVRTGDLQALYRITLQADSPQEFATLLRQERLESDAQTAIAYDDFIEKAFTDPKKITLFQENLDEGFKKGQLQPFLYKDDAQIPDDYKGLFHDMAHRKIEDGRVFILHSLLKRRQIANRYPLEGYDYSLELFLSASARHVFTKASSKANYKRNDMIDIYHLAYVNRGVKLLTKEKLLIDFVKEFQPLSFEDFEHYV
ncbi:hypothetical protein [Leptospira yasudae]|uniref:hypothetical protein n=1 Tax=Leptospira yasudae TaxID=2202201 RepID=UPI0010912BA5|nr:hypothetical protein [Leptospira yasudae]TGM99934.1 hypothetical protein EHR10_08730 [Leptospira yasudae]